MNVPLTPEQVSALQDLLHPPVAEILAEPFVADRGPSASEWLSVKDAATYTGCTVWRVAQADRAARDPVLAGGARLPCLPEPAPLDRWMNERSRG